MWRLARVKGLAQRVDFKNIETIVEAASKSSTTIITVAVRVLHPRMPTVVFEALIPIKDPGDVAQIRRIMARLIQVSALTRLMKLVRHSDDRAELESDPNIVEDGMPGVNALMEGRVPIADGCLVQVGMKHVGKWLVRHHRDVLGTTLNQETRPFKVNRSTTALQIFNSQKFQQHLHEQALNQQAMVRQLEEQYERLGDNANLISPSLCHPPPDAVRTTDLIVVSLKVRVLFLCFTCDTQKV